MSSSDHMDLARLGLAFKNQKEAGLVLDDNLLEAVAVLVDGLKHPDPWYRRSCALDIIKKVIPDKKVRVLEGPDGGPVQVQTTARRDLVVHLVKAMSDIDIDIVGSDGCQSVSEIECRTETGAQAPAEVEAGVKTRRRRQSRIKSDEGAGEAETAPVNALS